MDNKLKLNNEKTEALLLCSSSMSFSVSKPTTISVCGCEISFSSSARNLAFYIRDDMSIALHIKNVCQSAYSELHHICTIWHLISVDFIKTLWPPLSSLGLIIVTHSFLKIYKRSKTQLRDSSSKLINEIMFHPSQNSSLAAIQARIEYKLSTLCHSFFSDTASVYLADFLNVSTIH